MPTISKKELQDYQQLCNDRDNGKLLTPDGLRFICEAYHYNAEEIGNHFLELLPKICGDIRTKREDEQQ